MDIITHQNDESKKLAIENRGLRDLLRAANRGMAELSEEVGRLKGELSNSFMVNGQDELVKKVYKLVDALVLFFDKTGKQITTVSPEIADALTELSITVAKIESVK